MKTRGECDRASRYPRRRFATAFGFGLWQGILWCTALWSAFKPLDYLTWSLEVAPALIAYLGLLATGRSLPLTPLTYWLLLVLMVIILVGGHYGFSEVPLFDWLRDRTGAERNNFDKFAHFFQGFVPALAIRELIVRFGIVTHPRWRAFVAAALALALSALYELAEWITHLLLEEHAEMFIGAQGDPWDAQSDMAMALCGAITALGLLSRMHDAQLAEFGKTWRASGASLKRTPNSTGIHRV
jgi:putative membrane protein